VTLPKITVPEQVRALVEALEPYPDVRMEMMIETPQSIFMLPRLVEEARGRCVAAHFGTYDYTASLGITASNQHMLHPACDFARSMMQASLAGTGLWLSDGATNILPVGTDRPCSIARGNCITITSAIRSTMPSIKVGIFTPHNFRRATPQSTHSFLRASTPHPSGLRNFISKAAQATLVGDVFDDAATGQGLLNYFLRAINCGAIPEVDAPALTGLSLEELRSASFVKILSGRRAA
jgi:hypothetical protein